MKIARLTMLCVLGVAAACASCGGGGGATASAPAPGAAPAAAADISVLMFGNSHTDFNHLPEMLALMLRAGRPGKTVAVISAPGYLFLDERASDAVSRALFASRKWQAVVLQAQRYSSSGTVDYPISQAVDWVRQTSEIPAMPVMFPEWPRRGINETQRIFDLHVSIAQTRAACVAPIPQAWDLALQRHPMLVLHDADGNHAAAPGSFLAALVLYATLTGNSPAALPDLPTLPAVDGATQARLRAVAADQVALLPPRRYCPAAPSL